LIKENSTIIYLFMWNNLGSSSVECQQYINGQFFHSPMLEHLTWSEFAKIVSPGRQNFVRSVIWMPCAGPIVQLLVPRKKRSLWSVAVCSATELEPKLFHMNR
jgi:hypothetical protein